MRRAGIMAGMAAGMANPEEESSAAQRANFAKVPPRCRFRGGLHAYIVARPSSKTWMAGTSPAVTAAFW